MISKYQFHPFLQIPTIAWKLLISTYFPLLIMLRLINMDSPKQMLSDSKNNGVVWWREMEKIWNICYRQVKFLLNICSTTMINLVIIGASIQEHHKNSRNKTTKMMNSIAKKITTRCTTSFKILLLCFKQIKFWENHCICLTQKIANQWTI